jgi:GT2 family glycosyltransferase
VKKIPLFDERFLYYGDDKVMYHFLMNMLGFRYFVLPNNFIIHLKHHYGDWSTKERDSSYEYVQRIFTKTKKDLEVQFYDNFKLYSNTLKLKNYDQY